jgi:hypothetical protein
VGKVAKLVYVSLATRVVVDEGASFEEIVRAAKSNITYKVANELGENIEEIIPDEEMPYDPSSDDFDDVIDGLMIEPLRG